MIRPCGNKSLGERLFLRLIIIQGVMLAFLAGGCSWPGAKYTKSGPGKALVKLEPAHYPHFKDWFGYDANLKRALKMSLAFLERLPEDRRLIFGSDSYSVAHLKESLQLFADFISIGPDEAWLNRFIRQNYTVYAAAGRMGRQDVLFTGYFEPELEGSLEKSEEFPVPLHGRPKDLVSVDLGLFAADLKGRRIVGRVKNNRFVPYWDRDQINRRPEIIQAAKPIAWVRSRVDRFFLQVQGSGRIYLDNGTSVNVHYDGANGHPYRSIGRLLIDQGKIAAEKMSMQAIRRYLEQNPQEMDQILAYNPSYVFFKIEEQGPLGSINVPLTPGRSLATDRRLFPPGGLCYVLTEIPVARGNGSVAGRIGYFGFAMNQDTGGAIRGPGRADFFWGSGPYAEIAAGHMQEPGRLYFLVLKP